MDALAASREPEARSILRRLASLRETLMADCLQGELIPKSSIPSAPSISIRAEQPLR